MSKKKSGIELISEERKRQIEVEGWTNDHDSKYYTGQLVYAASCYLVYDYPHWAECVEAIPIPKMWPWAKEWWKPTPENRIRELQKAGALIAAEIDRLNNLKERQK